MPTLLRIDSSLRREGSESRRLADRFVALWFERNPDGQLVTRDLAAEPVPHLDAATLRGFDDADPGCAPVSNALIRELQQADTLLVSCPVYNFGPPSTLKAYLDQVIRSGRTFEATPGGYRGLLAPRAACIVTARGAGPGAEPAMQVGEPLRAALRFIGFDPVHVVAQIGTATTERARHAEAAQLEIEALFEPAGSRQGASPEWIGEFSREDREDLDALRTGQIAAIQRCDAPGYAALCVDDVLWMLPGQDLVSGRDTFLATLARFLRSADVQRMRKEPLRIERRGALAVEVGHQWLDSRSAAAQVQAPRQKYTHVFRRTADGWRFAVLMSNHCP